ncbi:MAG: trigger factor [Candidatus Muproteobacteria bacterium RBG_16_65_34]|uniref:Trigger factor n=1 Tax=Candidatus Muproteobacteria bacterium RBG_16_65_34 TaxID=1817760 RepID=A0A1F6TMH0_9PROT|nr:MAG: trigger factor [Candidatus Muproteobacteria bacterium RBG_16_65_34]
MQVSLERVGALGRRLTVAVPADEVEKSYGARLQRLSTRVKLPGFRPGKVPLKMVEARYGGELMEEVAGDLIETSFREAIGREGLRPAGGPRISRKSLARGATLEYTAEFEVYPEIERLDLRGVHIERPVAQIAAEDVERTVETIRKQRVTWSPIARAARADDRLKIDFVGRIAGKEFEGGVAKGVSVVLGAGTLLEGIENGLVGATAGEVKTLVVPFPADHRNPALAGQTVDFEVTVHEVAEPVLPELNAEFAGTLGVPDGSLETLRADIRANLEREAAARSRTVLRSRVWKALLEGNRFEVPQSLVNAEIARMKSQEQALRGAQPQADGMLDAMYRERARARVVLGLIVGEIVRARGLKADPARVRQRLEELAAEYESPPQFIEWHHKNPERLAEVESLVLEDRVVEELIATAEVSDKPMGFRELLQIQAAVE